MADVRSSKLQMPVTVEQSPGDQSALHCPVPCLVHAQCCRAPACPHVATGDRAVSRGGQELRKGTGSWFNLGRGLTWVADFIANPIMGTRELKP